MNEPSREHTKCPVCDGGLEKGVMQASAVVFWNKDNLEEHWTSTSNLLDWSRKVMLESPTWRYKNCHLAIFRYGKQYLPDE